MKYASTQVCPRSIRLESELIDPCHFILDDKDSVMGKGRVIADVGYDTPVAQIQLIASADDGSERRIDASLFLSLDQLCGLIEMLQAALPTLHAIEFDLENA
ncbi:hypothetical protein [Burkholderia sp. RF4-BP95]|uniref:hypothetical protein n=1 Tax=Burkholderia sp. RF4-BP95 TaxID=1637845 RepID=UPI00075B334B|nr:hypothetical protein [Burkholderia sp. RF4-BP95]KUY81979.1 hypothetical protein WS46_15890 [Burkholderia sp. RF4-BP95]